MDNLNSTEYYRTRERHARGLAQAAVDPSVAKIHLEMATRYSKLVQGAAPKLAMAREHY